jgi:CubicO group peptidase (beta-lactamase class C family)
VRTGARQAPPGPRPRPASRPCAGARRRPSVAAPARSRDTARAAAHSRAARRAAIRPALLATALALSCALASAAPDEVALGRDAGYPAAPRLGRIHEAAFIVGSFSALDTLSPHCLLAPADHPLALPAAAAQPTFQYRLDGRTLTLDDYLQRQRATGVLVLKDGEIAAERYNYGRRPDMRMVSNSMAKTLVALAIGQALDDGAIHSLDDTAARYVPELAGTLYGETRLANLLRMASGARYVEDYSDTDDRAAFNAAVRRKGVLEAARTVTERAEPQGERFNYAGAQTEVLGLVLRAATRHSRCEFVDQRLWQPLGAESAASYLLNPADGVEQAQGGFNATLRDYARLGAMLANDGRVGERQVVSRDWLLAMTDAARQPPQFRPGAMDSHGSRYFGYGYQVWLMPGSHRRFALLGVYGQAIFVDPDLKLVMVHLAAGADASGDASGAHLGRERDALWRGVVAHYGAW